MQKPRLTQKMAEALALAVPYWRAKATIAEDYDLASMKRALDYLEDLLRWQLGQQKETGK